MNTSASGAGHATREIVWQGRLARHAASGLGVAAFCEYESVSTARFYRWRALLSGQTKALAAVNGPATFIDLARCERRTGVAPSASLSPAPPTTTKSASSK
jgi:hypothetical protein